MNALFIYPIREEKKQLFIDTGINCQFKTDYTIEDIEKADIVFGNPKISELKNSKIKWLQLASAGVNQYLDLDNSVTLTNAAGAYDEAIAEYLLAETLAITKKLYGYYNQQKEKKWQSLGKVKSIKDLNIVCLGMGNIGKRYAKTMHLLGANICGVNKRMHEKPDYVKELYTMENLDTVLANADIVCATLPHTNETVHMFDYERLHKIKEGAILMNVGRGSLINEDDLVMVMKEKYLSACYLDVCEKEPLDKNSELWGLDNVYITPHITGGRNNDASIENVENIFYKNLVHYLNNEKLENVINRQKGY